jgi:cystatin-A/B
MSRLCGGVGEAKEVTPDVQSMVNSLKDSVASVISDSKKSKLDPFKAVSFKTQVVAGTNFFIKVAIDDGKEHIHLRVHRSLGVNPVHRLASHQEGHNEASEISYF